MRIAAALVGLVLLSGCLKMDVIIEPAPELLQADKVCIIEDIDTRETYRTTMKSWLREQGIKPDIQPPDSTPDVCEWTLMYYGRWSWCVGLYLAETEITAFHDGLEVGRVGLDAGQLDGYKWENGKKRIYKLMDMLSGKVDHYVLPERKNSKKK